MIELKNVTTQGEGGLKNYSLVVENGKVLALQGNEGELVIKTLLGFAPVEEGYVTFDGMLLTPKSAPFLRKMIAYVPNPEGFEDEKNATRKQMQMIDKALESDASILLAVNPVSHQDAIIVEEIKNRIHAFAQKGRIVILSV